MNERIKELAEQAGFVDYMVFNRIESKEEVLENFAQLIIGECAQACLDEGAKFRGEQDITDFKLCASVIKQHFGVE